MYILKYHEIGARIRKERIKRKLTQEKLAKAVELSDSFIGHIERGGRVPSIETIVDLANFFEINVEYLLFGEYNYQPKILPEEILYPMDRMNNGQKKVFLGIIKILGQNQHEWNVREYV